MKATKLIRQVKAPCPKCLYRLGMVQTLINPCTQCKESGYQIFDWFKQEMLADGKKRK